VSDAGAVAALDCGTNSTRLLVASAEGRPVAREMRITRLGQGVDAAGVLHPDAVGRTLGVLREYRAVMDAARVARVRLVATSAVRDAANGDEFLRSAGDVVGAPAELLSGIEEGRLAYAGATSGLELPPGPVLLLDIGGGSTELVTSDDGRILSCSMDIGCVRLTERFLHGDPPRPSEVDAARRAIRAALDGARQAIPVLGHLPATSHLVGVAGTVSTLAALELGLEDYDRDRIHHSVLTRAAVARWCDVLGAETAETRRLRPPISPGREDVIFGGALILLTVMDALSLPTCIASESDILDGLVMSLEPSYRP
jgi:exopolyphosphatase/guanosine-5'-triphosphate,3'-diphosphate pyrophosphatase